MAVHNIHIIVDEDEYQKLMKAKGSRSWHDFILGKVKK